MVAFKIKTMIDPEIKQDAIDKMRAIIAWADWQNEDFNCKIKSIKDLEKIYDYVCANELEFIDNLPYNDYHTQEDNVKHALAINKLLGYKLYDVKKPSNEKK